MRRAYHWPEQFTSEITQTERGEKSPEFQINDGIGHQELVCAERNKPPDREKAVRKKGKD
jgi:hypothetical protein